MTFRKLISGTLVAGVDQAWLSGLNFLIGLAFIHGGTKIEYGQYAMLFNGVLLVQSIQNALINSPMTTVVPGRDVTEQPRLIADLSGAQTVLALLLAISGAAVVWVWLLLQAGGSGPHAAALAFGIAALGVLFREFVRAVCYVKHAPATALATDLAYGGLLLMAVAYLVSTAGWNAHSALFAMGLAAAASVSYALWRGGFGLRMRSLFRAQQALAELWPCARWALRSVVVTWAYLNTYVYVVGAKMGASAVADLTAARLLLVPLSMAFVAWANIFRPRAARWVAAGKTDVLDTYVQKSLLAVVALVAAYAFLLFALYPFLQPLVLGEKYAQLEPLVAAWLAFFTLNGVRSVGMACMLTADRGYRAMYYYGWVAFAVCFPGVLVAGIFGNTIAVVAALCAAELVLAALIWLRGWPRMNAVAQAAE